jgi:hypothetical protein
MSLAWAAADGITVLKERTHELTLKLGKTALPFEKPKANWDPFLKNPEAVHAKWLAAHPDYIENLQRDWAKVDVAGYQLTRVLHTANAYLPRLNGANAPGITKLRTLSEIPDQDKDLVLASALAMSASGTLETIRLANMDFLSAAANLYAKEQITPAAEDPNWAQRAARNLGRTTLGMAFGEKIPLGFGLSLFGVLSYGGGIDVVAGDTIRNYGRPGFMPSRGWRDFGRIFMYVTGIGAEGGVALSAALNKWINAAVTDPGWKGFVARTAGNQGIWPKLITIHSAVFGFWNLAGSINFFVHKDLKRGAALGVAATGNLLSNFPKVARMGASTATVVGGSMVLLGATGLYLISANERLEAAHATEGLNREYLELAEYDNIAKALARNSDDGDSVGPILLQLSNYLGIDQKSLLQWLNDQDPDWVRMFVLKAFNVERGDDGFAKERNGKNFKVLPRGPIEHEHDIKYWDSIPDGTPPA